MTGLRCFLVFLFSMHVLPVLSSVQELWWNLTYVENANPDGLFERRVIGVNNSWPPPPIYVETTDLLVLHVTNHLDVPSTLHHHGLFFNGTPWMDGAQGLSECGITPGRTFDYVVPINSSGQSGTYWVHSHAKGQYVDGLRAPVVLRRPQESYAYDEEFTVVVGDWYHEEHPVLIKRFISPDNADGVEPVPDSAIVYFAQESGYLKSKAGTIPSPVTLSVGFNENATLPFEPGKTYRLRIVNTSAFSMFFLWIDGHDMRVIEVDGVDVEESPIDVLSIAIGQRYSVLVTARNDTIANWAIHANMDPDMYDYVPDSLNPNVTASITYNHSAPLIDHGPISSYTLTNDSAFVPVERIAAPTVKRTIELEVTFDEMSDGTNRGMFNKVTYNRPLVPALLSELTLGTNATAESAYGPTSFVLEHGEVVDLVVKNGDDGDHPFHIHGHNFMIMGRAKDYTSDDPVLNPPIVQNQSNPMRRDTIHVPGGGAVTLRFVADNPGAWFFHCHMEWHLESGLAIQLIEAPLHAQVLLSSPRHQSSNDDDGHDSALSVIRQMKGYCKELGLPSEGNAAGHMSRTDLSGWELGPYPLDAPEGRGKDRGEHSGRTELGEGYWNDLSGVWLGGLVEDGVCG
ncbi:ferroxidase [Dendrothele bispora CBS 962.96]|uniref:Ferroxidase n=1 Tax=Dendrothele bispora (strain CBS 962.96) TaxID=1314807 RepID=A0A4S8MBW7_DENBC|nr:ferroxidase [Dendrothele bispora CBS 962.96]